MNAKAAKAKPRKTPKKAGLPLGINRRREWRFELPLTATVEGKLPEGKAFKETAIIRNVSSGGAYFCLNSGVVVGAKLKLIIELPAEATEGRKVKLRLDGKAVRLERSDFKSKKQGVAVRFGKTYKFVPGK
jgi:c-di-GMP-binding flagellar brake protein YcgR